MDTTSAGRHGAFSRKDAITRFGEQEVRRRQESGRWHALWPGLLVEAARTTDPLTIASAAVLLGGDDALLAGPTAAHLHGCRSVEPLPVHLIVPYGHWLRTRPGLVVHNGAELRADREVREELPVLCLHRVLADMLCRSRPSDALALIDEVLARTQPGERAACRAAITRRVERRLDRRGTRRAARLLAVATGKAASPAESWFFWTVVDNGFPPPEVNWSLVGPDGHELFRLDYAWPQLRIAIEYNGYAYHVGREAEDAARAEDLRRRGWIVITVAVDDLAHPGHFEGLLEDAFRRRGVDMGRRTPRVLQGRPHRDLRERKRPRRAAPASTAPVLRPG
ncbi:hypothetical protein [Pseudonocardia sp. MH-G8]|uniref:hypothetical protein n=1 Tax=Pseudonocardia sp. MH-G8 TaxID=1854588 RepID=UPI000B9FCDBF|nr:hypothetical protein [Pseudonocardia sp. MH-G8]OZM77615.1 hypothetical protein CFP66_34735 [Pseudonocardia sp. MH-G8]